MIYKLINAGTIIDLIDAKRLAEGDTSELFTMHGLILNYELETNVTVHAAYNDDSTELLGIAINSIVDTLWFEHYSYIFETLRGTGISNFMFDSHIPLAYAAGCTTYQATSSTEFSSAWISLGYPLGTQTRDGNVLWEATINGPLKTDLVWNED